MGLRKLLLRVPALRRFVERRWITDPVERAVHDDLVRGRLDAPATRDLPADPADTEERRGMSAHGTGRDMFSLEERELPATGSRLASDNAHEEHP